MKLAARIAAVTERIQTEPVAVSNLVGAVASVAVGLGLPVDPEMKVGIIGLITTGATLFGRSKVTPTTVLTQGTVLPSGPGDPVVVLPADGGPAIVVAEGANP